MGSGKANSGNQSRQSCIKTAGKISRAGDSSRQGYGIFPEGSRKNNRTKDKRHSDRCIYEDYRDGD